MPWFFEKILIRVSLGYSMARRLTAIFAWLRGVVGEGDVIFVSFPRYRRSFCFVFPIFPGDAPKRLADKRITENTFVVGSPKECQNHINDSWILIFGTPTLEVWEKHRATGMPPLRLGLTDEEKSVAFRIGRDALKLFLANRAGLDEKYFYSLPARFLLKTDLDVALWVNGAARGSVVLENRPLGEGIAEAVTHACRDSRYKPLSAEELEKTRIEITVMGELKIPLMRSERIGKTIYGEKGYLLETKEKNRGWFLPQVFNTRRYETLQEFLADLVEKKAGVSRAALRNAKISIFEVDDFIESDGQFLPLALNGPIIKIHPAMLDSTFIIQRLRMAADGLCRIQESDGNIPPMTNPLTGKQSQIDWPRLAFSAWALAEFGRVTEGQKYLDAAKKTLDFLTEFAFAPSLLYPHKELTWAYGGQLALALDIMKGTLSAAEHIGRRFPKPAFDPIMYLQIASFLKKLNVYQEYTKNLLSVTKERFEVATKRGEPINLAVWAEAVNTFRGVDDEFSRTIENWLLSYQLSDGSFSASTSGGLPYTRGTGKIFEVLALEPQKNKLALEKTLTWLLSMQYDARNTFFVQPEIYPKIEGAFRHDYFNQEAWIDAAGHTLLGVARTLRARSQITS